MEDLFRIITSIHKPKVYFSDYSGYKQLSSQTYSVPRNYLNVVDTEYYFPVEEQDDIKDEMPSLGKDKPDIMAALYSDTNIAPTPDGTLDPLEITKWNFPNPFYWEDQNVTEQIKVIIPEGLRDPLSMTTKRDARICISSSKRYCDPNNEYRSTVRSMVKKMPGFLLFTSYQTAQFLSQILLTTDQYKKLLMNFL